MESPGAWLLGTGSDSGRALDATPCPLPSLAARASPQLRLGQVASAWAPHHPNHSCLRGRVWTGDLGTPAFLIYPRRPQVPLLGHPRRGLAPGSCWALPWLQAGWAPVRGAASAVGPSGAVFTCSLPCGSWGGKPGPSAPPAGSSAPGGTQSGRGGRAPHPPGTGPSTPTMPVTVQAFSDTMARVVPGC